jgi:hypothetical protein
VKNSYGKKRRFAGDPTLCGMLIASKRLFERQHSPSESLASQAFFAI